MNSTASLALNILTSKTATWKKLANLGRTSQWVYYRRITTMTLNETLKQLKALGYAMVLAQNTKSGAGDNQFGVSLGEIRVLAKKIRTNHALALSLWDTGNVDAQFLASLLIEPKELSAEAMDRMVRSITFVRVADWLNSYVVAKHSGKFAKNRMFIKNSLVPKPKKPFI
jgi:3-methyladenine DNA glycosylase AlkD